MERSDKAILRKAVDFYGSSVQELKAMEELGELIRAIARARTCDDEERYNAIVNLAEKMADVEIILEQLKIIHDNGIRLRPGADKAGAAQGEEA